MQARTALDEIRGFATAGRYLLSGHAYERMNVRNVTEQDVRSALVNASGCSPAECERWKVTGPDLYGDELTLVVVLDAGLLIVTVF